MANAPLKTRFIINPRSGRAARALPVVREFAGRHQATIALTEHPRHAPDLARQAAADGCDLVVAVGGDGTMNEIAGVLAGTSVTLGLIPCGSGDGLGRHLGVHGSIPRALEILRSGRVRFIDSGLADGHFFFTAAGLGFEAEIARRFNQLKKRGFLRYVTTSIASFLRWQPQEFTVTHDSGRETIRCFTLAIANANQYGNNAYIAPGAKIDDGLLDCCAVPPITAANALPLLFRLFHGTLARDRTVALRRSTRFVVERAVPGVLHTDGEVHAAGTRIEFTLHPASLRVMVPA